MPKKNIPLLKRLRTRFLRMRHAEHFNMSVWVHRGDCGTAMCIAGHALDLQGYKTRPKGCESSTGNLMFVSRSGERVGAFSTAQHELGLSEDEAHKLFSDYDIRTPKQAAERIERLISDNVPTR